MTKAELISKIAKKTKCSQAQAERVINATFAEVRILLGKGDSIAFTGFGSFSVIKRAKRKGRNPRTGKEMNIPATKVARFRPGKGLKEAISAKKK